MEIEFTKQAEKDLEFWRKSGNKFIQKKISDILKSIQQNPFEGMGKPEPLKYSLSGSWSRRINMEHRIVYEVIDEIIYIESLKGHY
ncbi:MAG: Txe/YoeB family addiction module toxin [Weeksellaceae bacterium]|nr:Txe/YoeB family addiction module toxin [Weeksellaceae bacterium]